MRFNLKPLYAAVLLMVSVFLNSSTLTHKAQAQSLKSLDTGFASQGWDGVGQLDLGGMGTCTAVLMAPDLALTAGHCMFKKDGNKLRANDIIFRAGLRHGRADATRTISRIILHPEYKSNNDETTVEFVHYDIALLQLNRPITHSRAKPFSFAQKLHKDQHVSVVSYGADRQDALSLQHNCNVLEVQAQAVILDCDATHGTSGAPVFTVHNNTPKVASIVSAFGFSNGKKITLGVPIQATLPLLLKQLATAQKNNATPPVRRP